MPSPLRGEGAEQSEADEGKVVSGTNAPSSVTAFGRATSTPFGLRPFPPDRGNLPYLISFRANRAAPKAVDTTVHPRPMSQHWPILDQGRSPTSSWSMW